MTRTLRQAQQDAEVLETVTRKGAEAITSTIYRTHERRVLEAHRWLTATSHAGATVRTA